MKTCTKCLLSKSPAEFSHHRKAKDGLNWWCKMCMAAYQIERHAAHPEVRDSYHVANRERSRAYTAEYRETHREQIQVTKPERDRAYYVANAAKRIRSVAEWGKAHPDRVLATKAKYREAHREQDHLYHAEYRKSHPGYQRDENHRRRVRERGGFVEKVDLAVLIERDKGICQICLKPIRNGRETIDHILPISLKGSHSYANTRIAHGLCNSKRGNRGAAQLRMVG